MKRAMVYLGLQDDEEHQYEQYGYTDYPADEHHDDTGEQGPVYERGYRSPYDRGPAPEPDRSGDIGQFVNPIVKERFEAKLRENPR